MSYEANVARLEVEFNDGWIQKYPNLFSRSLLRWHQDCQKHGLANRKVLRGYPCKGFTTYVAE
jgi:hypothetical protein